jgi:hypothetical protein
MKKLILFAILAVVLLSCKKSNSGSPINTITATIDDSVYTFNTKTIDTTLYSGGYIQRGVIATDLNLRTATVLFGSSTILTPTTYGLFGDTVHLGAFQVSYPNSTIYFVAKATSTSPLTVTVNSITSTSVQGTFRGTIYLNGDTTSTNKKVVTNGSFYFTK